LNTFNFFAAAEKGFDNTDGNDNSAADGILRIIEHTTFLNNLFVFDTVQLYTCPTCKTVAGSSISKDAAFDYSQHILPVALHTKSLVMNLDLYFQQFINDSTVESTKRTCTTCGENCWRQNFMHRCSEQIILHHFFPIVNINENRKGLHDVQVTCPTIIKLPIVELSDTEDRLIATVTYEYFRLESLVLGYAKHFTALVPQGDDIIVSKEASNAVQSTTGMEYNDKVMIHKNKSFPPKNGYCSSSLSFYTRVSAEEGASKYDMIVEADKLVCQQILNKTAKNKDVIDLMHV